MGRPKRVEDAELLVAARAVFMEHGPTASTREIARRSGLSEAAIFQRFRTKVDLFAAAMVPAAPDLDALFPAPGAPGQGYERLEVLALGLLRYFRVLVPVVLPLMTHPDFDFEEFARRWPQSPLAALRDRLDQYLTAEHERGAIAADPMAAGITLFATMYSLAMFEQLGAHGGAFDDAAVREVVRCLWSGLAPRGAPVRASRRPNR